MTCKCSKPSTSFCNKKREKKKKKAKCLVKLRSETAFRGNLYRTKMLGGEGRGVGNHYTKITNKFKYNPKRVQNGSTNYKKEKFNMTRGSLLCVLGLKYEYSKFTEF